MTGIGEAYECAVCHGTFTKAQSDEEAFTEALRLFPLEELMAGDAGIVCDDCFHEVMEWARKNMPEHLL